MSKWLIIRIATCALYFIGGLLSTIFESEDILAKEPFMVQMIIVIIPFLFSPLALLLIIGIQYIKPLQDKQWTLPNIDSNFFKEPLHFFHAGAYFFIAGGIGGIIGSLINSLTVIMIGFMFLSGGLGLFLGVIICTKVYAKKINNAS